MQRQGQDIDGDSKTLTCKDAIHDGNVLVGYVAADAEDQDAALETGVAGLRCAVCGGCCEGAGSVCGIVGAVSCSCWVVQGGFGHVSEGEGEGAR